MFVPSPLIFLYFYVTFCIHRILPQRMQQYIWILPNVMWEFLETDKKIRWTNFFFYQTLWTLWLIISNFMREYIVEYILQLMKPITDIHKLSNKVMSISTVFLRIWFLPSTLYTLLKFQTQIRHFVSYGIEMNKRKQ